MSDFPQANPVHEVTLTDDDGRSLTIATPTYDELKALVTLLRQPEAYALRSIVDVARDAVLRPAKSDRPAAARGPKKG